jgi:hypothetical protein
MFRELERTGTECAAGELAHHYEFHQLDPGDPGRGAEFGKGAPRRRLEGWSHLTAAPRKRCTKQYGKAMRYMRWGFGSRGQEVEQGFAVMPSTQLAGRAVEVRTLTGSRYGETSTMQGAGEFRVVRPVVATGLRGGVPQGSSRVGLCSRER